MYHVYMLACVGGIVFRRADLHHICGSPYIVFILRPSYGFMLWICIILYIIVGVAVTIVTIASSRVRCLYSNKFSSALTKHLVLCPFDLCGCVSLHFCVYVLKHRNTIVTIASSSARCLYSNKFSSALTKHLVLCPFDLCGCVSLHFCVYVLKHRNTMWLGSITCA